jgi:antitoxin component of RelBE/YafQ-DinJ toxin-antitoxin module
MRANKDGLVAARVLKSEEEAFKAVADAKGVSVSDLIREFVQREIKKASKVPAG